MKKHILFLLLLMFGCNAMQEETPLPHVVKIKGIGATDLRRKAEFIYAKL
jgi:hypothetical protein